MRLTIVLFVTMIAACQGYGEQCSRGNYGDNCAPGLTCSAEYTGETGTCVCAGIDRTLDVNDSCGDASSCNACRTGLICSGTEHCIVPGSVPAGGTCDADNECATGNICNRALRACEAPGAHPLGEKCGQSRECMAGLVCGSEAKRNVCSEPSGEGARCEADWCAAGLICGSPIDPTHCRPLGVVGSLCEKLEHCAAGLVCNSWYDPKQCDDGGPQQPCVVDSDCDAGLTCRVNQCG